MSNSTDQPSTSTQTRTIIQENNNNNASEPSNSNLTSTTTSTTTNVIGTLKLRGKSSNKAKVKWDEEVIDNEFMDKKKSKICCIYHKPKAFDESSEEDSDSSCGSNDSRREHSHSHSHSHNHQHSANDGQQHRDDSITTLDTPGTSQRALTPPPPNAYERQGGKGKGKA